MSSVQSQGITFASEMDGKYLTFWLDNRSFAIPIRDVVQIVSVQPITKVPGYPIYAKGIINLRGSVIPVIDMRIRFDMPEIEYTERTCFVVSNISGKLTSFIVDAVDEVTTISDEEISPPPVIGEQGSSAYLSGIGNHAERVILMLSPDRILNENDYGRLKMTLDN